MIDHQIPLSAGPAGAARIDASIPNQVASQTPLGIQPFKPIDVMSATSEAYKLADTIDSFRSNQAERFDAQKLREEKARDKMLLDQYQKSGGDLYSTGGLEIAAKELSGKVSQETYDGLTKRVEGKKVQELKLAKLMTDMDDNQFETMKKQQEQSSKMLNAALTAYDGAKAETQDEAKAVEAFNTTKAAIVQAAAEIKTPDGRPLYPPKQLEQLAQMNPQQLRTVVNDSKWKQDAIKQEVLNRLHDSQITEATSRNEKRDADIERDKQKATALAAKVAASGGKALPDADLETMAEMVRTQGVGALSRFGLSKEQRQAVIGKITELNNAEGISARDGAVGVMALKADQASLNKMVPQYDAVTAFENTMENIGEQLVKIAEKVDATGVPAIERWIRAGKKSVTGDEDVIELNARMQTFRTEAARIINNPNLVGVLSDSARHEIEEIIPNSASAGQIKRGVKTLVNEAQVRRDEIEDQMRIIKGRMKQGAKKSEPAAPTEEPARAPAGGKQYKKVGKYTTPDEVRADYKAGSLTKEEARSVLTKMGF